MAPRKARRETEEAAETPQGAPHPRKTFALFGHARAEEIFLNAFNAGSLHHAWLLRGERGIGKATFAYRAARFLISRVESSSGPVTHTLELSPDHPVSRQIAAGAHPSLFVLGDAGSAADDSGAIGVDAARRLRGFLSLTSTDSWRAVIVDAANDLNVSSANALLKAVEEPPARTVFFLVSHGAGHILPTIRSRCTRLSFQPLVRVDLEKAVAAACASASIALPEENVLSRLMDEAAGSAGKAVALLLGEMTELAEKLDRLIESPGRQSAAALQEIVHSALGAKNAEIFVKLCDLVEERMERKARAAVSAGKAVEAAHGWAELWRKFREQRLEVETLNLDKGAFLTATFSDIERVAQGKSRSNPGVPMGHGRA